MNKQKIEKAIEVLRDFERCVKVKADGAYETIDFVNAKETAISALEHQLTNGWIPVTEPPTEYGTYLVAWIPSGHTAEDIKQATKSDAAHYYEMLEYDPEADEEWEAIEQCDSYKIIAWQPLPEAYREVSE